MHDRSWMLVQIVANPNLLPRNALTRVSPRVHHRQNTKDTRVTPRLYIGTAGLSVWYSDDLGETLHRFWGTSGMYSETRVWALAPHPARPNQLLAGTDSGIYGLDIPSGKWTHLPSEMDSLCVWSVVRSPHAPDLVLLSVPRERQLSLHVPPGPSSSTWSWYSASPGLPATLIYVIGVADRAS